MDRTARLRFAWHCLSLARQEVARQGRQFMKPGQTVVDIAIEYGGSASINRQEIIAASKTNKKRRRKLGFVP